MSPFRLNRSGRAGVLRVVSFAMLLLGVSSQARAEPLTVVSWGGAYERAQQQALIQPFSQLSGEEVLTVVTDDPLAGLRLRDRQGGWDVVDLTEDQAIAACDEGLLQPLVIEELIELPDSRRRRADLISGAVRECSIAQSVYATVVAYDDRAFPGLKPNHIGDFFDIERFPGKRAVRQSPDVLLEWALMAEGVPIRQVYDLLSTERGLDLAFRKLETLRDHIVWWSDPALPPELLREGSVTMAMGFNGRFFAAINESAAPITVVWDGQLIGYSTWAIPKNSEKAQVAAEFIRFAMRPESQSTMAELIPYGPSRLSALERVGKNPHSHISMREQLPNIPERAARALKIDSRWYARTARLRERRFRHWLEAVR